MNGRRQEIGWQPFWYMIRVYEILAVIFGIVLFVLRPPAKPQDFFMILLVGMLVLVVFDMFARGSANERGITFQRYLNEETVPWREVEEVVWSPKSIRITLRDRNWLRRYLQFPLRSNISRGFKFAFGGEVSEPDFVAWVRAGGYLPEGKIRRHNRWTW